MAAGEEKRGDSSEQDDDQAGTDGERPDPLLGKNQLEDRDFSSYDTWWAIVPVRSSCWNAI